MGFVEAVSSAFGNYFNFSAHARRSEYWWFALFLFMGGLATALIDLTMTGKLDIGPVNSVFTLATIIPSVAVSVRRLHDIGRSGWFLLLAFIPVIGIIVLIYWACQPGSPGPNAYGSPVA